MDEMEALDLLPEQLRVALNFAAARHSAVEVLGLLRKGYTEQRVFNMILATDNVMVNTPAPQLERKVAPVSTREELY